MVYGVQRMLDQVANGSLSGDAVVDTLSQAIISAVSCRAPFTAPTGPKADYNTGRAKRPKPSHSTLGSMVKPAFPPRRVPPTHKAVAALFHPSQSTGVALPVPNAAAGAPVPSSTKSTSRLDYTRDYYHDLGLSRDATDGDIVAALLTRKGVTDVHREAYDILTDDYLRHIYDDARAFTMTWAEDLNDISGGVKTETEEEKKVEIDMHRDYYKVLGVDPAVAADSIRRGFRSKAKLFSPDSKAAKKKWASQNRSIVERVKSNWASSQKARDILLDSEFREKYDAGRIIRKGMVGYYTAVKKQKTLRGRK